MKKTITYQELEEMAKEQVGGKHARLVIYGDTKGKWLKKGLVAVDDDYDYYIKDWVE